MRAHRAQIHELERELYPDDADLEAFEQEIESRLDAGTAIFRIGGREAPATILVGDVAEPILGVETLEALGLTVDPRSSPGRSVGRATCLRVRREPGDLGHIADSLQRSYRLDESCRLPGVEHGSREASELVAHFRPGKGITR